MLLQKFFKISGEHHKKLPVGLKAKLMSMLGVVDKSIEDYSEEFLDTISETLITGMSIDEIVTLIPEIKDILGTLNAEDIKDLVTIDLWARYLKQGESLSAPGWHFTAKPKLSEDDPDGMHIAVWQSGPGRFLTLNQDLAVVVRSIEDLQENINKLPSGLFSQFPEKQWMYGPLAAPYLTPPAEQDGLSVTIYVKMIKPAPQGDSLKTDEVVEISEDIPQGGSSE